MVISALGDDRSVVRRGAKLLCFLTVTLALASNASAQYFGKNKVTYETFDFKVLETPNFDIYYYPDSEESIEAFARLAERWHARLSPLFGGALTGRQPLIIYANHPHFRQTNAVQSQIGEATGGLTEFLKNRVVLPFAGTLAETDHVLGHELVHAFQYAATGRGVDRDWPGSLPAAAGAPLWLVEGMAEYLSLGYVDANKAMRLRDAVLRDELPSARELGGRRHNPYHFGHAFMAYIGGRWGDLAVVDLLTTASERRSLGEAFEALFGMEPEEVVEDWHEALKSQYQPVLEDTEAAGAFGRLLREGRDNGRRSINVGPALSPDGSRLAFLSEQVRGALELFVMDVESGEIQRRLTSVSVDPHLESLQFTRASGTWNPDGTMVAVGAVSQGRPVLTLIDADTGETAREIPFPDLGEISNPSWSPDGRRIAFSATVRGFTDLYVYDLERGELERLTEDLHSALQPAWSPDGRRIAFATDRFTADMERLVMGQPRVAILDLGSGDVEALTDGPGKQITPQWAIDGSLYFISDDGGVSNIYALDRIGGKPQRLTNLQTGVSGITGYSPALSVAGDHAAFTVYEGGGYSLYLAAAADQEVAGATTESRRQKALLPPQEREAQSVERYLSDPSAAPAEPVLNRHDYRPSLQLDFITPPTIAAGGGSSGSFAAGSIGAIWSDMLGNHQVGAQLGLVYQDDEVARNSSATVSYLNTGRRFNWGANLSQVPNFSAGARQATGEIDGEPVLVREVTRLWEVNREINGIVSYPFSHAQRVEFSSGFRQISFELETEQQMFSLESGERISRRDISTPTPDSLNLGTASVAHVYDTSLFGGTAPVMGQRSRVELGGVEGDLDFTTGRVDYRNYWMPLDDYAFSLGTRLLHFGRYGGDAEDPRLGPLFLGSEALIRGYRSRRFQSLTDPVFNRLQGSRIAVGNLELRQPLSGPQGFLGGGFGPPIDAIAFYDTGVAWSSGQKPSFAGGDQSLVESYGVGLRTNLGGFLVLELSYLKPTDRPDEDWHWEMRLTPGF